MKTWAFFIVELILQIMIISRASSHCPQLSCRGLEKLLPVGILRGRGRVPGAAFVCPASGNLPQVSSCISSSGFRISLSGRPPDPAIPAAQRHTQSLPFSLEASDTWESRSLLTDRSFQTAPQRGCSRSPGSKDPWRVGGA